MTATDTIQRSTYRAASTGAGSRAPESGIGSHYRPYAGWPKETQPEPDASPGPFGRLAAALGGGIAFVLALIMGLIGTVLPILVVVALFMGPGDTWDMLGGWIPGGGNDSPACEGFDDWYEERAGRSQRLMSMLEDFQSDASADAASLRSFASEADTMAAEQRRSNPPQEAVTLNGIMVETFELWADALRAVADGNQAAFQTHYNESLQLSPVFDAEEERVFDVCR